MEQVFNLRLSVSNRLVSSQAVFPVRQVCLVPLLVFQERRQVCLVPQVSLVPLPDCLAILD